MNSNPHPSAHSGSNPGLLAQTRAAALPALGRAFDKVLTGFDDELFNRAETAGASQLVFLDGMRELRRRREDIAMHFGTHLKQAWDALDGGTPLLAELVLVQAGRGDGSLSLMSEHELESRLAVRNFASVVLRDWRGSPGWMNWMPAATPSAPSTSAWPCTRHSPPATWWPRCGWC